MNGGPAPGAALARRARFGEMMECWLEVRCGPCGGVTYIPIKMLARRYGEGRPVGSILGRLACRKCRAPPSEVWLNEEPNRLHGHGGPPGWSVQLIGAAVSGDSVQDGHPLRHNA